MLPEDTFTVCGSFCDEEIFQSGENESKEGYIKVNGFHQNNPTTATNSNQEFLPLSNDTCFTCNGYYGPCFDDPVCSLCHAFLFPNNAPCHERPLTGFASSDSDSGNDEPHEPQEPMALTYTILRRFSHRGLAPVAVDTLNKEIQRLSVASHETPMNETNLDRFPPEVLLLMFQYLDDLSLWSVGQICTRWREVLFMFVKPNRWKEITCGRWPLLNIDNEEADWYEVFTSMMNSACCFKCVRQMAAQNVPFQWPETMWRGNRLKSEIKAMRNDPLDGIEAIPFDGLCCHWQATIEGPVGSPYEGGKFFLYIQVPLSYPLNPPVVRFITKIFHPNVSRHGDIGIDSIYHNWSLALTISKLLLSIQSLLTDPYCEVCMEPAIGDLYLRNRKAFDEQARLWTALYAMNDLKSH